MELSTEQDINKRLPSGYYVDKTKPESEIVNGSDCLIRDYHGKELVRLPSMIFCNKDDINDPTYSFLCGDTINKSNFELYKTHYLKFIDKKEYSYSFSNFYYLEGETAPSGVPTKLLLHKQSEDYNGYKYTNKSLVKEMPGIVQKSLFEDHTSIIINSITNPTQAKTYFVIVENENNSLNFKKGPSTLLKYTKTIGIATSEGNFDVKFYFESSFIPGSEKFEAKGGDLEVTVTHKDNRYRNAGTLYQTEKCQYGIYKIKSNGNYDTNMYIALKFDELMVLPNYIKNFYTKEETASGNNDKAHLSNNIQPTEKITEVYVIKSY